MTRIPDTMTGPIQALRKIALQCPQAEEGVSCGKQAFKAQNKAFFFIGQDATTYNLMLKLRASLPEATKLAAQFPSNYAVGGTPVGEGDLQVRRIPATWLV